MANHQRERVHQRLKKGFEHHTETDSMFDHSLDMEFSGVYTVHVTSVVTEPLQDYDKSKSLDKGSRYGAFKEVGDEVQTFEMTGDKSLNLTIDKVELPEKLELEDKWVLSKLNNLIAEVTENLEKYELGVAIQKIYDFIWDIYCDWYIEMTKARLFADDADRKHTATSVLVYVLDQVLRLLHPYMPFITEEIWQSLPHEGSALIVAQWPQCRDDLSFRTECDQMESVMDAIRAIRNRRTEMNVPPSKKAAWYVLTAKPQIFTEGEGFLQRLAYADAVTLLNAEPENLDGMVTITTADAKLYIPMGQLVDVAKEIARITKELEGAQKFLKSLEGKLSNEKFVSRAPEAVVNAEREKAAKHRDLIAQLEQSLAAMQRLA